MIEWLRRYWMDITLVICFITIVRSLYLIFRSNRQSKQSVVNSRSIIAGYEDVDFQRKSSVPEPVFVNRGNEGFKEIEEKAVFQANEEVTETEAEQKEIESKGTPVKKVPRKRKKAESDKEDQLKFEFEGKKIDTPAPPSC